VADPTNPLFVSGTNNGGSAEGLLISSNVLFLANYYDGLRVYEISNPTNVINIAHTNNGGLAWNVALSGNYLFLANGSDGLRVYDVSNPTNIVNVGHTNNGGTAYNITTAGRYAYLANGSDGLRIYDISDASNPINVGHTNDGAANGVGVYGGYAYVLFTSPSGLGIYEVSDPSQPGRVKFLSGAGGYPMFHGLAFSSTFTYATRHDGLYLLDTSVPASPLVVAYAPYSQAYGPSGVCLADGLIFLANQSDGLRIFSVAGPKLGIASTGTNLFLSWPSSVLNFKVQFNPELPGSQWVDVTNATVPVGGTNQVVASPTGEAGFYRLKLP